ncbi:hypothetical protein [Uliginosibacterium gangwonense]|uniref:hypothetical protein n=1 Tax=Uliginosibacterium gangwonense TaxID=392736 RepID=UPI0003656758|nr:hypothetical protein [Uliginosibacterium gangwonense]
MSAAFEHFLTGKDRLSALLNKLPVHEAPAGFEHAVFEAIRAQRNTDLPSFEPPASLESSFLQEASKIDAAQEVRRNAVLAALADGQRSQDVLGSPLSDASEAWLKTQLTTKDEPTPAHKPAKKQKTFWHDFGLVAATALVATIATSLYLHLGKPTVTTQVALAPAPATEPQPVASDTPPNDLATATFAEKNLSREAAPVASATDEKKHGKASALNGHSAINAQPAQQDTAPLPLASPAPAPQVENRRAVQIAEAEAPASPPPVAVKPSLAMAPPPRAADNAAEGGSKVTPPAALAVAPAPEKADLAGAVNKAKRSKALTSLHDNGGVAQSCLVVALKYDPRLIAQHLEMTHCGQIIALKTAIPDAPETQEWAERFRLALPENRRPATLPLEKDSQVPFNLISIEALPAQSD